MEERTEGSSTLVTLDDERVGGEASRAEDKEKENSHIKNVL